MTMRSDLFILVSAVLTNELEVEMASTINSTGIKLDHIDTSVYREHIKVFILAREKVTNKGVTN